MTKSITNSNTIPEFVAKWREKHGVSGAELGRKLGVTRQYVSGVETEAIRPAVTFAALLIGQCTREEREALSWLMHETACEHYADKEEARGSSHRLR